MPQYFCVLVLMYLFASLYLVLAIIAFKLANFAEVVCVELAQLDVLHKEFIIFCFTLVFSVGICLLLSHRLRLFHLFQ